MTHGTDMRDLKRFDSVLTQMGDLKRFDSVLTQKGDLKRFDPLAQIWECAGSVD